MAAKPKTYAAAAEQAQALLNAAALADPDSHFPYRRAAADEALAADAPMGPGVPGAVDGAEDRSREIADYMTPGIADATDGYVAADATYRADPNDDTLSALLAAQDTLVAARMDHRANRGHGFTIGAAARR